MTTEYQDEIEGEEVTQVQPSALLAPVRAEVIALNEDTPRDVLLMIGMKLKNHKAEIKQFEDWWKAAMIESVKAHGNIPISDTIYYTIADDKTTKCNNVTATAEKLLELAGGDWNLFGGTISSNGIKPGAAKKLLGDAFPEHFTVTVKEKLVEGKVKPVKKLLRLDEKFTK